MIHPCFQRAASSVRKPNLKQASYIMCWMNLDAHEEHCSQTIKSFSVVSAEHMREHTLCSGLYLWSDKPLSCHPRYLSQGYASYIIWSPAVFSFAIIHIYLQSLLISHPPHILILRFYFWLSSSFVLYYSCLDLTTRFTLLNNFTRPRDSLLPRTPYFQNFLLFSSLSVWCSGQRLTP